MAYYFEDLEIGQSFVSPSRTVTETDVTMFAAMTGDFNPLHTDEEFCKTTQFGTRIAHGLLVLALTAGLKNRLGLFDGTAIAFLSVKSWDFKAPVKFGDTVRIKVTISEKRETKSPERGIITQFIEVLNQRNELVQQGEQVLMVKRRV